MKENESVVKHVHTFKAHLEQLLAAGCPMSDDETIFTLIRSLPPIYRTFVSSLRRHSGVTLQSLITVLMQKETLMKDINLTVENTAALYVQKKSSYNNNIKRTYFNNNKFNKPKFNKFANFKGKSNNWPFGKKNFNAVEKRCFYCKKPGHRIKDQVMLL